jgi:hypothetical protein
MALLELHVEEVQVNLWPYNRVWYWILQQQANVLKEDFVDFNTITTYSPVFRQCRNFNEL